MAPQKETIMLLKVDLDCVRCYRKVKKLLCQFHQIHDQVFNEKQNTVMIKVVCCSPEKIRDKLCCKAGKSIKSIEILQPRAPKPVDPAPAEKPKEEAPPPPEETPAPPPAEPNPPEKMEKNGSKNGSRKIESPKPENPPEEAPPAEPEAPPAEPEPEPAPEPKPDPPPPAEPAPTPVRQSDPVQRYPVYQVNPVSVCCPECYAAHRTGPCNHGYGQGYGYGYGYGYGVPTPPGPAGGWGYYDYPAAGAGAGGYGGGGYSNYKPGYCVSRCGDYISDENPTACAIM